MQTRDIPTAGITCSFWLRLARSILRFFPPLFRDRSTQDKFSLSIGANLECAVAEGVKVEPSLEITLKKLVIGIAAAVSIVSAQAHSWYPLECCSGQDCHEADAVTELPEGNVKVQVGDDIIIVPRTLKRRPSKDGNYHICYRKSGESTIVHCFFEPAQA